jgi:hypothetical protein
VQSIRIPNKLFNAGRKRESWMTMKTIESIKWKKVTDPIQYLKKKNECRIRNNVAIYTKQKLLALDIIIIIIIIIIFNIIIIVIISREVPHL